MVESLTDREVELVEKIHERGIVDANLKKDTLVSKVDTLYPRLKRIAREGEFTTYSELTDGFSLAHRYRVGRIIGVISVMEYLQDRPLISAIVVSSGEDSPGDGFFELLDILNLDSPEDETQRREVWENHVDEVYDFWAGTRMREVEEIDEDEKVADFEGTVRVKTTTSRIIRNTEISKDLKGRYSNTCQVCGEQRYRAEDETYAEAHHLQPLGRPHDGPDIEENMLVLCPNHHADFDYGLLTIETETMAISHSYEPAVDGRELHIREDHNVEERFLEYHNVEIAEE